MPKKRRRTRTRKKKSGGWELPALGLGLVVAWNLLALIFSWIAAHWVLLMFAVLVVGAKLAAATPPGSRFHLAERAYGRFARVVRLAGAIDSSRAQARVDAGQLRIIIPRLEDRRGRTIDVPVERG